MITCMPAALEKVCQYYVVWAVAGTFHVLDKTQRSVKVMLIHQCLDQDRVSHDVRSGAFSTLHLIIELKRLWQAACTDKSFNEQCAHDGVHRPVTAHQKTYNLMCGTHVVVHNTGIQKRAESDVVWL